MPGPGLKYRLQIEQLKEVLSRLGSPHLKIPVISIAGTNGKGSVAGLIQSILTGFGKKIGLFTSPHIFNFTERIKINDCHITIGRFKLILKKIKAAEEKAGCMLTKFEIMTAAAIRYFCEEECDLSVMEAGLGGRLDATNVCENKLVSVITPISLEHVQYLGNTQEKIAIEKAGIIKPLTALVDASGIGIIRKTGLENNCRVYTYGMEYEIMDIRAGNEGNYGFTYISDGLKIINVRSGLKGVHQVQNTATAITAVCALGFNDSACIKKGIYCVSVPGRLEVFDLPGNMKLIVDAAHNPAGMKTVKDFIGQRIADGAKLYLIMGLYKDKDYKKMVQIIGSFVEKAWTFTPQSSRALEGEQLAKLFKRAGEEVENFEAAYERAIAKMRSGDWLLACGSFSVVKPALELMKRLRVFGS